MRAPPSRRTPRFLVPGAISVLTLSMAVAAFVTLAILTYHSTKAVHTPTAENALLHLLYESANFGLALGYFTITALITRGLWRQGRVARSNYLGIAAGLIFATCGAGHLVHVALAHLGDTALAGPVLYAQVGADVAALLVAALFLSLRERYSLLTGGEAALVDMRDRLAERIQAETALREREERLRLALEAGGMGAWDWDIATGQTRWSDAVVQMLDVDGEPCTAQTFLTRVHPEDRGALEQAIAHAIQTHTEYQQEFRAVWRDGQVRWLEGRGRVYYAADGRALRMIGVATDITARKHAQEEAWRLQEQAALAASALEADRLKTALLNTVSHELRTPLGVIKGFASTLLAFPGRLDAAEQRAFLQEIESAADRLTDLVNDLLEVSRMESGTVPMQQEPLRLGDLLRRATADASRRYPERHITLDTSCNPGIRGDPHRLVQVAVNLIDNAVKFSPDGGEVAVSAWCAQGIAGFSVRDRGIGIAPEYHGRIFDRFYRVDTPRAREIGGAGLGLALCREIIERHGGTITVESAAGAGTTVTVRLPTRTEPLEAEAAG